MPKPPLAKFVLQMEFQANTTFLTAMTTFHFLIAIMRMFLFLAYNNRKSASGSQNAWPSIRTLIHEHGKTIQIIFLVN
jgi:hypothetical protein